MAKTLYLVSNESHSGKSAICLALALGFKEYSFSVNYMKPVGGSLRRFGDDYIDEDAYFAWQALGIDAPWELASPVLLTQERLESPLEGPISGLDKKIASAFETLSQDRDLMILEGLGGFYSGLSLGLSAPQIADVTDAHVLCVIAHHHNPDLDTILLAKQTFGDRLEGIVVNGTPPRLVPVVQEQVAHFTEQHNIPFFGVLARDRLLRSISVGDLAEEMGGEVLCAQDQLDEMVETYMLGAMGASAALRHFQRVANKAVITGGDRSDVILAALETPTKCLVLTGNLRPSVRVLGAAAEAGVPIILVKDDTLTATDRVEKLIGHVRLSSPKQVGSIKEKMDDYIGVVDALKERLFPK